MTKAQRLALAWRLLCTTSGTAAILLPPTQIRVMIVVLAALVALIAYFLYVAISDLHEGTA